MTCFMYKGLRHTTDGSQQSYWIHHTYVQTFPKLNPHSYWISHNLAAIKRIIKYKINELNKLDSRIARIRFIDEEIWILWRLFTICLQSWIRVLICYGGLSYELLRSLIMSLQDYWTGGKFFHINPIVKAQDLAFSLNKFNFFLIHYL